MLARPVTQRYVSIIVIFSAIQVFACCARTEWNSISQRFDGFSRMERATRQLPEAARTALISASYYGIFAAVRESKTLDSVGDDDLQLLYRAARLATFYTQDQECVHDMASILDALQARGLVSDGHYLHMYETYVGARMLTEAHALARQHPMPELEALPELRETGDILPGHPTEWVVEPDKYALLRRSVDLHQPIVVIISHPRCHFSLAAMQAIHDDPVLSQILATHAQWLAPQDNHLDVEVIQHWNREHFGQQISLTVRRDEWPMIDSWATPTFYFLQNGAVSAKVEGWPKQGRQSALLAALRKVGLLQ